MNPFRFPKSIQSVMCLGAHPDDIEIGAAATLAFIAEQNPDAAFQFVILTGSPERAQEAYNSCSVLLGGRAQLVVGSFLDGMVPYASSQDAKQLVRSAIPVGGVDLVFSPQTTDLHQDHKFLGEVARQLFRDHMILEYEIAKFDGGLVPPNVYVPVSADAAERKVDHIESSFPSQAAHRWFTRDAFLGLMRLRGVESNAPDGYAEAFTTSKIVLA